MRGLQETTCWSSVSRGHWGRFARPSRSAFPRPKARSHAAPTKCFLNSGGSQLLERPPAKEEIPEHPAAHDLLAYELLEGAMVRQFKRGAGAAGRQPPTVLLVHGILGSRRNMQSFAGRLLAGFPSWQVLLVDLRCHGESACNLPPPPPPHSSGSDSGGSRQSSSGSRHSSSGSRHSSYPGEQQGEQEQHSVAAAAADVLRLLAALRLFPDVLVGHSFGGKVVLEMWEQFGREARQMPKPVKVWVLDAVPGPDPVGSGGGGPSPTANTIDNTGSSSHSNFSSSSSSSKGSSSSSGSSSNSSPEALIAAMRALPLPAASRREVVGHLQAFGFTTSIAAWAATNLVPDGAGGLVWGVDLEGIAQMYRSFKSSSQWHVLERQVEGFSLGFVRAEASAFDWEGSGTEQRIRDLGHSVHLLPNSSHWVHAEHEGNPQGLFEILAPSFGSNPDLRVQLPCGTAWGSRQGQASLQGGMGAVPPPAPQLDPAFAIYRTNNAF